VVRRYGVLPGRSTADEIGSLIGATRSLAIFQPADEGIHQAGWAWARANESVVNARSRRKLLDRMIAAQALVHRATLVTLNASDFRDVPGLELLSW
jgi:hypothetical protein